MNICVYVLFNGDDHARTCRPEDDELVTLRQSALPAAFALPLTDCNVTLRLIERPLCPRPFGHFCAASGLQSSPRSGAAATVCRAFWAQKRTASRPWQPSATQDKRCEL